MYLCTNLIDMLCYVMLYVHVEGLNFIVFTSTMAIYSILFYPILSYSILVKGQYSIFLYEDKIIQSQDNNTVNKSTDTRP